MSTRSETHRTTSRHTSRVRHADTASTVDEGRRNAGGHSIDHRSKNPFLHSASGAVQLGHRDLASSPGTRSSPRITALDITSLDRSISVYSQDSSTTPVQIPAKVLEASLAQSAPRTPRLVTPFQNTATLPNTGNRPYRAQQVAVPGTYSTEHDRPPSTPPSRPSRSSQRPDYPITSAVPTGTSHYNTAQKRGDGNCETREQRFDSRGRSPPRTSMASRSSTPTRRSSARNVGNAQNHRRASVRPATLASVATTMESALRRFPSLSSISTSASTASGTVVSVQRRGGERRSDRPATRPHPGVQRSSFDSDATMFDSPDDGQRLNHPIQRGRSLSVPSSPSDTTPPTPPMKDSNLRSPVVGATHSRIKPNLSASVQAASQSRISGKTSISGSSADLDSVSIETLTVNGWTVIPPIEDPNASFGFEVACAILSLYDLYINRDNPKAKTNWEQLMKHIDEDLAPAHSEPPIQDAFDILWWIVDCLDTRYAIDEAVNTRSKPRARRQSLSDLYKVAGRSLSFSRSTPNRLQATMPEVQTESIIYKIQQLLHVFSETREESWIRTMNFVVHLRKSMESHPATLLSRLMHLPSPIDYSARQAVDPRGATIGSETISGEFVDLVDIIEYVTNSRNQREALFGEVLQTLKFFVCHVPELDARTVVELAADRYRRANGLNSAPPSRIVDKALVVSLLTDLLESCSCQMEIDKHSSKFVGLFVAVRKFLGTVEDERKSLDSGISDALKRLQTVLDSLETLIRPYYGLSVPVAGITEDWANQGLPELSALPCSGDLLCDWVNRDEGIRIELLSRALAYWQWSALVQGSAASLVLWRGFPPQVQNWVRLVQNWVAYGLDNDPAVKKAPEFFVKLMHRCFQMKNYSSAFIIWAFLNTAGLQLEDQKVYALWSDVNEYFLKNQSPVLAVLARRIEELNTSMDDQPRSEKVPLKRYREYQKYGYSAHCVVTTNALSNFALTVLRDLAKAHRQIGESKRCAVHVFYLFRSFLHSLYQEAPSDAPNQ